MELQEALQALKKRKAQYDRDRKKLRTEFLNDTGLHIAYEHYERTVNKESGKAWEKDWSRIEIE